MMPRTKEQNEAIREQRKKQILEAALAVYIEKGYAAAEIGDVAKQSGVARGLVYYYFKDKLTLFRQLFEHMFSRSRESIHTHFQQPHDSQLALLKQFADHMLSQVLETTGTFIFFMRSRHDIMQLYTKEELRAMNWHGKTLNPLIKAINTGIEKKEIRSMSPELLASQFWGALVHAMAGMFEKSRQLRKEGLPQEQIEEALKHDLDAAASVCMAMLRPPTMEHGG